MDQRVYIALACILLVQCVVAIPLFGLVSTQLAQAKRGPVLALLALIALPQFFFLLLIFGLGGLWFLQPTDTRGLLLIAMAVIIAAAFFYGLWGLVKAVMTRPQ